MRCPSSNGTCICILSWGAWLARMRVLFFYFHGLCGVFKQGGRIDMITLFNEFKSRYY